MDQISRLRTGSRDVRVEGTQPAPGGGGPGPPTTADIQVTMSSSPAAASVPVGTIVTYTITVQNNGPLTANTITFNSTVSGAFINFSFGVNPVITGCSGVPPTVTCNPASMPPGSSFVVTVAVQAQGGALTNTATASAASPPDGVSNNSAMNTKSVPLRAPSEGGERLQTRFTSHLDVPPGDGSAGGRVTSNGERSNTTDSSGPATHDVLGRSDDNVVEGIFVRNVAEGRWRFVFSRAPHFELGSFAIDEGQVVAQTSDELVFRVGPDARRVRFRFRLKR